MTPPTQQDKPIDLEALRLAAERANNFWPSNQEVRSYRDALNPATALALLALIAVQQKKIAALEVAAGFASDLGVPNDGIGL